MYVTEVIILFKVQNTSNSTNIKCAYSRVTKIEVVMCMELLVWLKLS